MHYLELVLEIVRGLGEVLIHQLEVFELVLILFLIGNLQLNHPQNYALHSHIVIHIQLRSILIELVNPQP